MMPLASRQLICDYCLDWHAHAALVASGETLPRGCQECNRDFSALDVPGTVETRMYVVKKDGVLQLLCPDCMLKFIAKTPQLVKNTEFGAKHAS